MRCPVRKHARHGVRPTEECFGGDAKGRREDGARTNWPLNSQNSCCISVTALRTICVRSRICLALIVGLLFCSLGSLEIPELVKLADDSSNDFTILHSPQEIAAPMLAKQAPASLETPQEHAPGWISDPIDSVVVVALHPHASDQLIHLLCIQRT